MANFKFKRLVIGLCFFILPALGFAAPTDQPALTAQTNQQSMPKDTWLEQVKAVVSEPICKGFLEDPSIAERFKAINLTYDACLQEIPPLTEACIKQFYAKLPENMTQESAATWGRTIGECIGDGFAKKYLYTESTIDSGTPAVEKKMNEALPGN